MWHKWNADYSYLRMFECDAYAHVAKESRNKFDPNATKCIFLGYQRDVKGYRIWEPVGCKLVVSWDVSFNEYISSKERRLLIMLLLKAIYLPQTSLRGRFFMKFLMMGHNEMLHK